MADPLAEVKVIARTYHDAAARNQKTNQDLAAKQKASAEALDAIIDEVEDLRVRTTPVPAALGDLSDLPPEVLAELSVTKVDQLEHQLHNIIAAAHGREVDLDTVIIELWRRHKVHHPRRFLMNKLYRMAGKDLIVSVEGRKGVYTVPTGGSDSEGRTDLSAEEFGKPQKRGFGSGSFDDDLDDDVPF